MGQYRVILADPPWEGYHTAHWYLAHHGKAIGRVDYYQTLSLEAIAQLPVSELADKSAAVFMWTTGFLLPESPKILAAWGFRYAGIAFNWVKLDKSGRPLLGVGHYTRHNAEYCVLGIRGKMRRKHADVSSVILARRRQHSRKPDEQYERIMRLFDGPYLEMFSRQQWSGWDTWGNQTDKFPAQPFLLPESMVSA